MRRPIIILGLMLALAAPLTLIRPVQADSGERCFAETGYCISGAIRQYWERNGGLPVFGYPITAPSYEGVYEIESQYSWAGPVQWFERDRLEDHSAEGQGVMAGRLGAQVLTWQNRNWVTLPKVDSAPPGCRYFPATGHSLCDVFLREWERNGGLARFGYPITEPMEETVGSWSGIVQYFERRRMEFHTELPGLPVLYGLLGRELRTGVPSYACTTQVIPELQRAYEFVAFRNTMGCPTEVFGDVQVAEEYFERGVMVYVDLSQPGFVNRRIYVIRTTPLPVVHSVYIDTWDESQPESGNATPPPGLYEPKRGFGKIWREIPGVRELVGWATGPERGDRATVQTFSTGSAMVWFRGSNFIYNFGPGGATTAFGHS